MTQFTKNLVDLKTRIRAALAVAERNENDVSILAVSKRHNVDAVHKALSAGLHAMGENYVQEALEKIATCEPSIEWHFIGRIQSNKTRQIAENFSWVQTVCDSRIARRLNDQRPDELPPLNVCVQVCVDEHSNHGGLTPDAVAGLCEEIAALPKLRLRGLMTIPEARTELDEQRRPFRRLRKLHDKLRADGFDLDTLSMGMTNDLEAAVLEGSTMLRIGTALFGPRPD